jgi:hypothetical protein
VQRFSQVALEDWTDRIDEIFGRSASQFGHVDDMPGKKHAENLGCGKCDSLSGV